MGTRRKSSPAPDDRSLPKLTDEMLLKLTDRVLRQVLHAAERGVRLSDIAPLKRWDKLRLVLDGGTTNYRLVRQRIRARAQRVGPVQVRDLRYYDQLIIRGDSEENKGADGSPASSPPAQSMKNNNSVFIYSRANDPKILAQQTRALEAYPKRRNLQIDRVFVEKPGTRYLAFKSLLASLRERHVSRVLIYDPSRLPRNDLKLRLVLLELVRDRRVNLQSLKPRPNARKRRPYVRGR